MITQTYNLNLIPDYNSVPIVVHTSQYDDGARVLVFNLLNGDVIFNPDNNTTCTIEGTKPDGHSFAYDADVDGATVTVPITQQMAAVPGKTTCELRLRNENGVIGTANFILAVEMAGLIEDADLSNTDIPAVIELATEQMKAAQASATYAQQAADDAQDTLSSVIQAVAEAIATNLPIFNISPINGHLYWLGGRFVFDVNNNTGHLLWEVS